MLILLSTQNGLGMPTCGHLQLFPVNKKRMEGE